MITTRRKKLKAQSSKLKKRIGNGQILVVSRKALGVRRKTVRSECVRNKAEEREALGVRGKKNFPSRLTPYDLRIFHALRLYPSRFLPLTLSRLTPHDLILVIAVFIIFLPALLLAGTVDLPRTGQTTTTWGLLEYLLPHRPP